MSIRVAVALLLVAATGVEATEQTFSADRLPNRLYIGAHFIFHNSDSVWFNDSLLQRGADYRFNAQVGAFELGGIDGTASDTVIIRYRPLPNWLERSYGRTFEAAAQTTAIERPNSGSEGVTGGQRGSAVSAFSDVKVTGSKAVRFYSATGGGSEFSQALDLRISGQLAENVEISGAVTDRGYDPTYGTSNSRLSELERVNLTLRSPAVTAQVGDISVRAPLSQSGRSDRRVSGAAVDVRQQNWSINGMAARPKGRFATARFTGRDGVQGPYRIISGTQVEAIVPGSEEVWLDGRRLQRGADKDYVMDYPTGRITFNVNQPIDRRSRIEIDYEVSAETYREELFSGGGGVAVGDSSLVIGMEWSREGDDREQLATGELTDGDKSLLAAAGDDPSQAVRSGIVADTTGAYDLVVDSLPDSVFVFVGAGNGDYSMQFSYVGAGAGSYLFRGDNNYDYAGAGNGEYEPVVFLALPQRVDYFTTTADFSSAALGNLHVEWRLSQFDRNLWSSIDDSNNDGNLVQATYDRSSQWHGRMSRIVYEFRHREQQYYESQRFNRADFSREFLLPDTTLLRSDEQIHRFSATLPIRNRFVLEPRGGFVRYASEFRAFRGGLGLQAGSASDLLVVSSVDAVSARLDSMAADGGALTTSTDATYRLSEPLMLLAGGAYDRRTDEYTGSEQGARYYQWSGGVDLYGNRFTYEKFVQDTLTSSWSEDLDRNRLSARTDRRFGNVNIQTILTYQWLTRLKAKESSFLSRVNMQYDDFARRINANASYVISEESRNARGIAYIEVDPGQGQYIKEGDRFIPDPDGNYIQVEEILSDEARVRRGEKGFSFSRYGDMAAIRFNSTVEEELKPEGQRSLLWLLPFYSDDGEPYQFQVRRYDGELRLLRTGRFWAINLSYGSDRELREIAGTARLKDDYRYALFLRQAVDRFYFEQGGERFVSTRDAYYNGGGDVDGFRLSLKGTRQLGGGEVSAGGSFRRADAATGLRSDIAAVTVGSRVPIFGTGEFRSSVELYTQDLTGPDSFIPYLLTENRSGRRGVIWSVDLRRDLRDYLRARLRITGRHADDRTARITARGEVMAQF